MIKYLGSMNSKRGLQLMIKVLTVAVNKKVDTTKTRIVFKQVNWVMNMCKVQLWPEKLFCCEQQVKEDWISVRKF